MASSSATPIQKGNYQRRKPGERSRTGETSALNNAGVREEDQATNDTSNPNQFIGQEDFISFDFSPSPPPPGGNSSRGNQRDHRGSTSAGDHRSGSKRKHDDEEDVKQEEGTRQLRKREKERSTPWCDEPGVSWSSYDNATSQLNAEAKSFISYISPTPVEHELRMWTIEIIRRTIKSKYSDADVQCFGSVGTGLYLPGGDIDLVVLCPSMPSPPLKPSSSLLHRLASLLLTSSIAQPSSLVVIAKARVPIVKFTTRYGGFAVDLSVNQKNGVDAAVRVRGMLEDFAFREEGYVEPGGGAGMSIKGKAGKGKEKEKETTKAKEEEVEVNSVDHGAARSMVLLVKAFLAQRGMNEVFTGGLGSYSIICLVISFLQLHPRIQSAQIQPSRNIGLLFLEFLEYYGKHFNFDEAGITLKGRGGYFNKHDKGWFRGNQPYLLSIEDPNDPQNDVSGGSHNIIRVRQTLAGGFDTLSATLLQRQSLLSSQRNPSLIPLSSSSLPNADSDPPSSSTRSLLGSIIGMTRAGVDARGANVRLWDDGVLQSILDRIGGGGDGMFEGGGKKAMKRARKEERERERREKTIAKLERRVEEKEKRASRKKEKKRGRQEGDDGDGIETEQVTPVVDPRAVVEAQATAAKLKGLAGPDEDSEFTRKGDMVDEEEEGSRYSLGVPTIAKRARKVSPQPRRPIYSADASSDSSNDSGQEDQDDVVLGGGGGDFVRFDSAQHSEDDQDDDENDSGSDSSEEVLQSLVPASSRFRINGAAAEKKKEEAEGAKELERTREPPKKKKSGANSEAKKKAKAASRIAFWGAKGPKE